MSTAPDSPADERTLTPITDCYLTAWPLFIETKRAGPSLLVQSGYSESPAGCEGTGFRRVLRP